MVETNVATDRSPVCGARGVECRTRARAPPPSGRRVRRSGSRSDISPETHISHRTHGVKSPLNVHLATPARGTFDTRAHDPHKKDTPARATLGVPSDKTHTVRVEHLCACIYAWSTAGRARWSFRARVVLCRSRACARGRIAHVSKHMDVVFKCTTRARWRFARATDRDRKNPRRALAAREASIAMLGVTTPHERRRPRTTLAQHTNI